MLAVRNTSHGGILASLLAANAEARSAYLLYLVDQSSPESGTALCCTKKDSGLTWDLCSPERPTQLQDQHPVHIAGQLRFVVHLPA